MDPTFKLGTTTLSHKFYVVSNINRNFILGRDWLRQQGVRLYFDLGCLTVNNEYISFVPDAHIANILRTISSIKIQPNQTMVCSTRAKKSADISPSCLYEVTPINKGYISHQPGLIVTNSVDRATKSHLFSVAITNTTNRTFVLNADALSAD